MMEMPRPSAEAERLVHALSGTWEGPETMHPSPWAPEKQQRTARYANRSLDGFFLLVDYEQTDGKQVTFRGHGVYSWAQARGCYHMYWFDSMGQDPGPPIEGHWSENELKFQHQHAHGHHRYIYRFPAADTMECQIDFSPDGESWTPFHEGRYTRS